MSDEDWKKKLVAVGTDGAAVMVGKKTGVVVCLKEDRDWVVGIHCLSHRLKLAFRDAVKGHSMFKKLESVLMGIYYFYHNSPLNRSNLKAAFSSLAMSPLMPTRIGGTRWVAHLLQALDNFLRVYKGLVLHLEQVVYWYIS